MQNPEGRKDIQRILQGVHQVLKTPVLHGLPCSPHRYPSLYRSEH
jgi:hypothetical protein